MSVRGDWVKSRQDPVKKQEFEEKQKQRQEEAKKSVEQFEKKVSFLKGFFDKKNWAIGGLLMLVVVLVIGKIFD